MNLEHLEKAIEEKKSIDAFKKVNHVAKLERFIAAILIFTPLILYLADLKCRTIFRESISNYFFMLDNYWFGSLMTLASALFIFNGAQHMYIQQTGDERLIKAESRFGKGYNFIFGIALLGVLYFDHIKYVWLHYIFAIIFFMGCALAMLLAKQTELKLKGEILGTLTLLSLGIHFLLEYCILLDDNPFTLLWAEWIGLFFIAIYFILESFARDNREKEEGLI